MTIRIKKPITNAKLEKAERELVEKKTKRKGFNAKKHVGKLKGVFGDAVKFQRKLRDEWD